MKLRWKKQWTRDGVFFILGAIALLIAGGIITMIENNKTPMGFQPKGVTITWLPKTVQHFAPEIEKQAARYDIDANLVAIIMTLESGGYTKADSGVARGLMQVTPTTAGDIAKMYVRQPVKSYDLFTPKTSIEFGVAYLAHLRTMLCGNAKDITPNECAEAIAAGYNGGPGAALELLKGNGIKANETLFYSRNAYSMWREQTAPQSPTYTRWLEAGGQTLVDKASKEQAT